MPEPKDLYLDSTLTNMSVQYRNEEYIWPMVMPVVRVGKCSGKYFKYDKGQRFRVPDDAIGSKSLPNEVDLKVSNDNYSVEGHSLSDWVSQEEMDNADTPLQPLSDANDLINDLLDLAQEKRVADIVFAAATYPTGNKVQLSGTDQWSDHANSDPIDDILAGLDAAFLRPNTMVFGNDVWTKFRSHPKIVDAVKASTRSQGAQGGIAQESEIAALFRVERVLVGAGRVNTAKEGQADSFSRIWGKHCSLLHVKNNPGIRTVQFGATFSHYTGGMIRKTFRTFDGKRGESGAEYVKTAWNSDEKVVAADVGYLIEDAIA